MQHVRARADRYVRTEEMAGGKRSHGTRLLHGRQTHARRAIAGPGSSDAATRSEGGRVASASVTSAAQIPAYYELLWPTLRGVREIGDSGTIEEIVEKVIDLEGFTEDQQSVQHGDGP